MAPASAGLLALCSCALAPKALPAAPAGHILDKRCASRNCRQSRRRSSRAPCGPPWARHRAAQAAA
eukprot:7380200-Pyramimonas_sp.AAC.1